MSYRPLLNILVNNLAYCIN